MNNKDFVEYLFCETKISELLYIDCSNNDIEYIRVSSDYPGKTPEV